MTVELFYVPDCPHRSAALNLVREVLQAEGLGAKLTETRISNHEEALKYDFPGSPTLRVNGRDIEDVDALPFSIGVACRTYRVNGRTCGLPPRAWLERAIRAASVSEENCR